jgi:hypothetical protein
MNDVKFNKSKCIFLILNLMPLITIATNPYKDFFCFNNILLSKINLFQLYLRE